jgi:hypothetical protein
MILCRSIALAAGMSLALLAGCTIHDRPRTPIMGWSSWNHFRVQIDEDIIRGQADAMVTSGMKAAGYRYVNIDDGYFAGRAEDGTLQTDTKTFPSGMKSLADYIHARGLRAGTYSDAGSDTCASQWDGHPGGTGAGLHGYDEADLRMMLVDWGYDFIKIDWCGGKKLELDEQTRYTEIGRLIRGIRPDVVFNVCRWQFPGEWVTEVADSWRVSGDIAAEFSSICRIIDLNADLWMHAGPGHVNDMDMLQVGRGMTLEEDRAHFSMWCMLASPLIAGNDLRSMNDETTAILTHPELIAINQDPDVVPARRVRREGDLEVWIRPLAGGRERAVALFNRSDRDRMISFPLSATTIDPTKGYSIRNCWKRHTEASRSTAPSITRTVPSHGVVVLRLRQI